MEKMGKTEKKPPQFVIIKKETKEGNENKPKENPKEGPKEAPKGGMPNTTPTNTKPENKNKKGPFSPFWGKTITIQATRSSVLYIGELIDYTDGFLVLKNAKIIGTKHIAEVDILYINRNQISHIHTEPKSIKENTPQNNPENAPGQ